LKPDEKAARQKQFPYSTKHMKHRKLQNTKAASSAAHQAERASTKHILSSFDAARRPWWSGVSVGVLAVSLGMAGASEAATVVSGGTATALLTSGDYLFRANPDTSINRDAGKLTIQLANIDSSTSQLTLPSGVTFGSAGLQSGMTLLGLNNSGFPVKVPGGVSQTATSFVVVGNYGSISLPVQFSITSGATISDPTTIANLNGSDGEILVGGMTYGISPGTISKGSTVAGTAPLTLNQGAFSGSIGDGTPIGNDVSVTVANSSADMTLSGQSAYTGGTILKSTGKLRIGLNSINPNTAVIGSGLTYQNTPLGEGLLKIEGGQLSGANTSTIANAIEFNDGVVGTTTVALTLGTLYDSRTKAVDDLTVFRVPVPLNSSESVKVQNSFNLTGNIGLSDSAQLEVLSVVKASGSISGLGGITKTGVGMLRVSGASTYTGGTVLKEGELRFESNSALIAGSPITGNGPLGRGTVVLKGGILSSDGTPGTPRTLQNAIQIGEVGVPGTVGIQLGRGEPAPDSIDFSGSTSLVQASEITVAQTDKIVLSGVVSGGAGAGFIKLGRGDLNLENVINTFSGSVTLQEGSVSIPQATALGTGNAKVNFAGGYGDANRPAGMLIVKENTTLSGGDIAARIAPIAAGQEAKVNVGVHVVTFIAPLSGAGGLRVSGSGGTLVFDKNTVNTYTGQTVVESGATVEVNKSNTLSSSSDIVIRGTLDGSAPNALPATARTPASGFAFRAGQPVEVRFSAANGGGVLKLADGTSFANADLATDIENRLEGLSGKAGIVQVIAATTSAAIPSVKLKVITPIVYSKAAIGVPQSTASASVSIRDFFGAQTAAGVPVTPGAVTGTIASARPINKITWSEGTALTWTRQSYSAFGQGQNGANFGAYLDDQINATSTRALPRTLRYADANFATEALFTRLMNETSAQPFADMVRSGFERSLAVLGGLEDRVASLTTSATGEGASHKFGYKQVAPMAAAAAPRKATQSDDAWAAWTSVYGREAADRADSGEGASKLKNTEGGVQFGVERQLGNLIVGLTGATGWGRSSYDTPSAQISSDSWHLGAYAAAPLDSLVLDASFIYGLVSNQSTRTPQINGLLGRTDADTSYRGKFDSRDLSISVGLAYNMLPAESAFQAAPVLRLTYLNYSQSAFSETESAGAGVGGLGYNVGSMNAGTFLTKLGYRLSYNTKVGASTDFGADLGAYWQHDWDNKGRGLDASLSGGLSGTSYQAVGRKSTSDIAIVNGGLQLTFNERYLIRGSTAVEFGGKRENLTGSITFGLKF
jgi:autotransporter-associated beta strand protein